MKLDEAEHACLRAPKTGYTIHLRGDVTGIVLRTALRLHQAVGVVP